MKFFTTSLSIAALAASIVTATPLELSNRGTGPRVACPADTYQAESQTYTTYCHYTIDTSQSSVILLDTVPVKNFVQCLEACSTSSDNGNCCKGAKFDHALKQCSLYAQFVQAIKGKHSEIGIVSQAAAGC